MTEKLLDRKKDIKAHLFDPSYLFYKFLIPDLKEAIQQFAMGDVLDIGCGNKPYKVLFPNKINKYIGCDIEQSSEELVDIICSATDLKFLNESFNTVFSTQVLEHVYDHKKSFYEISRVLKKDGYFIGSLPMVWPHHEEPYDFFRFTKYGLKSLMEEVGLEVVYIKGNGGKWALLGQLITLSFTELPMSAKFITKIKRFLFRATLSKVWVNLLFGNLDKISSYSKEHHTMNFVFVGKKK